MAGKKTGEERRRTPSVVVRSREETQSTIGIDGEDSTTGRRPRSSRTNDGSSQEHDCSSSGNSFVDAFCRDDSILCLKHLDDSIKDTIQLVNKSLIDEIQARRVSPEPSHSIETNAMTIQLTINTLSVFVFRCDRREMCLLFEFRERTETIDVLFLSTENQSAWKKSFLEAKKTLCKTRNFILPICSSSSR